MSTASARIERVRADISSRTSSRTFDTSRLGHLEQELVVHLEDEARASPLRAQPVVDRDHRDLDDVRVRALHDEVHGDALAEAARLPVRRAELGNRAAATEEARRVAVLAPPARSSAR